MNTWFTAATMASAAPGRFALGIGSSSDVIVERWNGVPFEAPYQRVRDTVRFLRAALTGEKVTEEYDSFTIGGFRLGIVPERPPTILVAALREGMLRLAGREADGAIINWLSPDDVTTVAGIVNGQGPDREIVARIFVCPSDDREVVLSSGRYVLAAYLNVPVYRAFHEWMGRGDLLGGHWERWAARHARPVPGPNRRVRRQRCDHAGAGDPAVRRPRHDGGGPRPRPERLSEFLRLRQPARRRPGSGRSGPRGGCGR